MRKFLVPIFLASCAAIALPGCDIESSDNPLDGETAVEDAAEDVGESVEDAGDAMSDMGDNVTDAVDDAADELSDN